MYIFLRFKMSFSNLLFCLIIRSEYIKFNQKCERNKRERDGWVRKNRINSTKLNYYKKYCHHLNQREISIPNIYIYMCIVKSMLSREIKKWTSTEIVCPYNFLHIIFQIMKVNKIY